ncbi:MAG: COX15/CtaA family protein [Acidimicrobiales bacterium]
MSPARYLSLTRAALWSLTIIVISGGAVRLTGSGLGCSDWPNCEQDQLVSDLEYHGMIEFGNRMFTGVVTIAVAAAVLGSLRRTPRRTDLVWLSLGLVAGVVAQIVLGGLLVKTELDPRFTMGHFLLSMVLLWNATVLMHRAALADGPVQGAAWADDHDRAVAERRIIRRLTRAVMAAGAVVLVMGTIVTGSGPHSGSDEEEVAERLPFLVRDVTRLHSMSAIVLLLGVGYVTSRAHRRGLVDIRRAGLIVTALVVAQGVVGYWQYFAGVPVVLVAVHILLASLAWIHIVRLDLEARLINAPAGVRILAST